MNFLIAFFRLLKGVILRCARAFGQTVRRLPRLAAALLAVLVIGLVGFGALQATRSVQAVQVLLNNVAVGFVKDHSVIAKAQVLAVNTVSNSQCNALLAVPTTQDCVASSSQLLSAQSLSELIISGSAGITKSALLYLDSNIVAKAGTAAEINGSLQEYIADFKTKNNLEKAELSPRVAVKEEYTTVTALSATPDLKTYLSANAGSLPVEEVYTTTEVRKVNYKTTEIKTEDLYIGSTKIKTKGVAGQEKVTYRVTVDDNGTEQKTEIGTEQITAPVDEQVLVGTKKMYSADKNGNAPMLWPVKRVSGSYVSSYVGDDRNHKGMDIVAKAGTPVYAAAAGTVSYAGYSSGYGNYIIIDHGNGLTTLYAHNSTLAVSKGDQVAAGESIAAVGRTGYATGNHLHFEVRVNGSYVNPVPYIGSN